MFYKAKALPFYINQSQLIWELSNALFLHAIISKYAYILSMMRFELRHLKVLKLTASFHLNIIKSIKPLNQYVLRL